MKRPRMMVGLSIVSVAGATAIVACAESSGSPAQEPETPALVPTSPSNDAGDARDAECETDGGPPCEPPVSCADVSWCPVQMPVD